ncbi:MAG: hypothetical protein QM775_14110 [Pirellulales bacterium]
MLSAAYKIRLLEPADHAAVVEICRRVYPTERPYTLEELDDHWRVFPEGQFAAVDAATGAVAGVHLTLRLRMTDFHVDDSWDVLTSGGTFLDHDPQGPTLYGRHHGSPRSPTSRPRAGAHRTSSATCRIAAALAHGRCEPLARLRASRDDDGRQSLCFRRVERRAFRPCLERASQRRLDRRTADSRLPAARRRYAGWAMVIQWVNPASPPPPELSLEKLSAR